MAKKKQINLMLLAKSSHLAWSLSRGPHFLGVSVQGGEGAYLYGTNDTSTPSSPLPSLYLPIIP